MYRDTVRVTFQFFSRRFRRKKTKKYAACVKIHQDVKKKRMSEHITQNIKGFRAMWQVVSNIMNIKNKIINQFDSHDADIKANIGDTYKGGEGYVLQHPGGDIKLVNRAGFTAANRSIRRD